MGKPLDTKRRAQIVSAIRRGLYDVNDVTERFGISRSLAFLLKREALANKETQL